LASKYRLGQGEAFASIKSAGNTETLLADRGVDLTRWRLLDPTGREDVRDLGRLVMSPVLLAQSGRKGFARVGSTRITYVRDSAVHPGVQRVGDESVKVEVLLRSEDPSTYNLPIAFVSTSRPGVAVHAKMLFTGSSLRCVAVEPAPGTSEADAHKLVAACRRVVEDEAARRSLFASQFRRFKYNRLGVDRPNAWDFFGAMRWRLGLIEYADTPVLVASKVY